MRKENRQFYVDTAEFYDSSYYNPPLALWGRQKNCETANQLAILGCGNSDDIRLFRDGDATVIYSANDGLEYMSLAYYVPGEGITDDIYLDSEGYRELEDLQPINRAKAMLNYF